MKDKKVIENRIREIEAVMGQADFWSDKDSAQKLIREYQELKNKREGVGEYDKGNAVMSVFSGAGGDDAEDFSRMLLEMYFRYFKRQGWETRLLHENKNDHGGYRNVTLEIHGKSAYGTLKNESGVHRLVRLSPFNAKKLRHTSFSMVEVIPDFKDARDIEMNEADLKIEFARSSGPGGQNVNKRETAVRIVHLPTNLSVHVENERTQEANRRRALELLRGKLYKLEEDKRKSAEAGMYVSKTTEIEWGNQIRSYVLHPYQMVKDHRTLVETSDTEGILKDGKLDKFIAAERGL